MASKFFGSDSSDASSESSDSEAAQPTQKKSVFSAKKMWSDSSSSEDEVRVIKSQSVKRMDAFVDLLRTVRVHMKNNDYTGLAVDYSTALKSLDKHQAVSGADDVPKAFIRVLYELDSFVSELQASGATKKMSQIKAQAVNKLKAQMKKSNKPFDEQLTQCAEDPSAFEILNEVESEESDDASSVASSSSADSSSSSSSSSEGSSFGDDASSDSDESSMSSGSSFDSSSSSSSSSDDDELSKRERRMSRWLKDSDESDYEVVGKKVKVASGWEVKRADKKERKVAAEKAKREEGSANEEEVVPVETVAELTEAEILTKVKEIVNAKSHEGVVEKMDEFEKLSKNLNSNFLAIAIQFATASLMLGGHVITDKLWVDCASRINRIIEEMAQNPTLYPVSLVELDLSNLGTSDRQRSTGIAMVANLAEQLDDEFGRWFQELESTEYAEKLALLPSLMSTLISVLELATTQTSAVHPSVCRLSLKLLWHLHYQSKESLKSMERIVTKTVHFSSSQLFETILSHGSKKEKASAILLSAFIASTNGETDLARKLIASDLFDLVAVSEVSLQIQYNRAIAQVGLACFQNGDVADCYSLLTDLCTSGRLRELLAQGLTRLPTPGSAIDRVAEAERQAEKKRLLPFHVHLNVELIEAAYGLSALIIDCPALSGGKHSSRRIAKYKRQLDSYDRQMYTGPPEFAKDAIVLAGKAIMNDDLEGAVSHIEKMKIWSEVKNGGKILNLVRIAGLQAYLLNNANSHKAFDLDVLAAQFKLDLPKVHSVICKLIISEDIPGKLKNHLFLPTIETVSKTELATISLNKQIARLELVRSPDSEEETQAVIAAILAQINPAPGALFAPLEVGARRVRGQRVGLANAKALAASQQAAERRLQAGVARRRGWDNARQPLQGTVITTAETSKKRIFGKSYGY